MNVRVDASSGQDHPLARDGLGRHTHDHVLRHTFHHVGIAGLADPCDAPAFDPDVRLPDTGPVDDEGVRDDAIEGGLVRYAARLPQAVAQHLAATELALVAVDGGV